MGLKSSFFVFFLGFLSAQVVAQENDFEAQLLRARAKLAYPDSALQIAAPLINEGRTDSLGIELYRLRGSAFFYKGVLDSAMGQFSTGYGLLDPTKCTDQFASLTNAFAVTLQSAGLYEQSIEYYSTALGCAEFRNDTILKLKIYNNLSVLHREIKEYGRSKYYLQRAMELIKDKEASALTSIYNSMGQNYLAESNLDSAHFYFKKSCSLREEGDLKGQAICLNNLGYVAALKGNYDEASDLYLSAAKIREQTGDMYGSASIFVNMADLALDQGKVREANLLLQNAILLNDQVASPSLRIRILNSQSHLAEAEGNMEQALKYLRMYNHIRDSLDSEESRSSITERQYSVALAEAENQVKRIKKDELRREQVIRRQRLINFLLAIGIAVFIGLTALFLYQLRMLSNLRKELTHQRDLAESQAKQRRETLNAVVHELRTPMNAIIALSDLQLKTDDHAEMKNLAERLKKSSDRLLTTTNNILSFARLEEGSSKVVAIDEDLTEIVSELCAIMEPQARAKNLEFTTSIKEDVRLRTDRAILEIVLLNLIGNAIKYTNQGGVHVELSSGERFAHISVKDTGIGISSEDQQLIFSPFFQAKNDPSVSIEGAGLGLSIVKYYVDLMKIELKLESEEGEGSCFTLVLRKLP